MSNEYEYADDDNDDHLKDNDHNHAYVHNLIIK